MCPYKREIRGLELEGEEVRMETRGQRYEKICFEDLLALKMEEGAMDQGCRQPLDTGKDKEVGNRPEPPEGKQAC